MYNHNKFTIDVVRDGMKVNTAKAFNVVCNNMYEAFLSTIGEVRIVIGRSSDEPQITDTSIKSRIGASGMFSCKNLTPNSDPFTHPRCELLEDCVKVTMKWKILNNEYVGQSIAEIGVSGASNYSPTTRALLRDAEGNPIQLLKTDLDILYITAEIFLYEAKNSAPLFSRLKNRHIMCSTETNWGSVPIAWAPQYGLLFLPNASYYNSNGLQRSLALMSWDVTGDALMLCNNMFMLANGYDTANKETPLTLNAADANGLMFSHASVFRSASGSNSGGRYVPAYTLGCEPIDKPVFNNVKLGSGDGSKLLYNLPVKHGPRHNELVVKLDGVAVATTDYEVIDTDYMLVPAVRGVLVPDSVTSNEATFIQQFARKASEVVPDVRHGWSSFDTDNNIAIKLTGTGIDLDSRLTDVGVPEVTSAGTHHLLGGKFYLYCARQGNWYNGQIAALVDGEWIYSSSFDGLLNYALLGDNGLLVIVSTRYGIQLETMHIANGRIERSAVTTVDGSYADKGVLLSTSRLQNAGECLALKYIGDGQVRTSRYITFDRIEASGRCMISVSTTEAPYVGAFGLPEGWTKYGATLISPAGKIVKCPFGYKGTADADVFAYDTFNIYIASTNKKQGQIEGSVGSAATGGYSLIAVVPLSNNEPVHATPLLGARVPGTVLQLADSTLICSGTHTELTVGGYWHNPSDTFRGYPAGHAFKIMPVSCLVKFKVPPAAGTQVTVDYQLRYLPKDDRIKYSMTMHGSERASRAE